MCDKLRQEVKVQPSKTQLVVIRRSIKDQSATLGGINEARASV